MFFSVVFHAKGQLISKRLFAILEFFQKTQFNHSTVRQKTNLSVRLLEKLSAWKKLYNFVWSLALLKEKKHRKFHWTQTFDATHSTWDSILWSGQKLELEEFLQWFMREKLLKNYSHHSFFYIQADTYGSYLL